MSLSIVRPTSISPTAHRPKAIRKSTRKATSRTAVLRLTEEQGNHLEALAEFDEEGGWPTLACWLSLTPGGRCGPFGNWLDVSMLTDHGCIELVEDVNLRIFGRPALGRIKITDSGFEALITGIMPPRLPDVDWGAYADERPQWVDRTPKW